MSITLFNDFMSATGQATLTSQTDFLNEATKRSYFLTEMMKGRGPQDVLQGGSSIVDYVMFDEANTYENYSPSQTFVWSNPQVLTNWQGNWRMGIDHKAWEESEVILNAPSGFRDGPRNKAYKSMKVKIDMRAKTSLANGLETELWRLPVAANMEADAGLQPYSIPALINENTNGLYTGWTTKQGIAPATYSEWVPQQVSYAYSAIATLDDGTNNFASTPLIRAFDSAHLRHRHERLPLEGGSSEAPSKATMIAASELGVNYYVQNLRFGNDTFVTAGRQDPAYDSPQYMGIPVIYVSDLDTAALYDDGSSGFANEAGADSVGPRYYWINRNYFKPVFHSEYYMKEGDVMRHPNQPTVYVQIVQCWHNYIATSLRRHAIVYPS